MTRKNDSLGHRFKYIRKEIEKYQTEKSHGIAISQRKETKIKEFEIELKDPKYEKLWLKVEQKKLHYPKNSIKTLESLKTSETPLLEKQENKMQLFQNEIIEERFATNHPKPDKPNKQSQEIQKKANIDTDPFKDYSPEEMKQFLLDPEFVHLKVPRRYFKLLTPEETKKRRHLTKFAYYLKNREFYKEYFRRYQASYQKDNQMQDDEQDIKNYLKNNFFKKQPTTNSKKRPSSLIDLYSYQSNVMDEDDLQLISQKAPREPTRPIKPKKKKNEVLDQVKKLIHDHRDTINQKTIEYCRMLVLPTISK